MLFLKKELRLTMLARRAEAHAKNPAASLALRDRFLEIVPLPTRFIIAGYCAMGQEMDPWPLMEALHAQGHILALPVVGPKTDPLIFRVFKPGDLLATAGKMKIREPDASASATDPDIILTPLLAFDIEGNRLGYGGGYYDRTLTHLRTRKEIIAVGIAYDCQRVENVPHDDSDSTLDKIVTENEAFEILKF